MGRGVQDATVASSCDTNSVAGGGEDHQPYSPVVRVGSTGSCLVTVAANSCLWRSDVRRSGSCRAVGTLEELPHWNRDWRIRLKPTGFVYRAHNPRWALAADSGEGAASAGGRFNPVGQHALYTSPRFETAWLEAQQAFPFKAGPMTLCSHDVDCEDVLDLTSVATLVANGINPADLACPWKDISTPGIKPPSWEITERLVAAGTAAVVVPSYAKGAFAADMNIVFWDWANPWHSVRD
jgi:RES domain-containing protein